MALGGCGGSKSSTKSTPAAPEPSKAAESGQTSSQAQGTTRASKTAGYGSTESAWDGAHTPDSDFASGSAYDQDTSLPHVGGHAGARYTEVHREGGRIVSYVYNFPSAPIAAAERAVLSSQLPADVHRLGFAVKPSCAVMLVESKKLRRELAGAVPHTGTVAIIFNSGAEA